MISETLPWMASWASPLGLRYEEPTDERWMRAWEPFVTLRTPLHFAHAVHGTSERSVTVARAGIDPRRNLPSMGETPGTTAPPLAWTFLAIVQDPAIQSRVAISSDAGGPFAEHPGDIHIPRLTTGVSAFDYVFATYGEDARELSPSLQKLALSWGIAAHIDVRPGGFVFAPVSLPPTAANLQWILRACLAICEKAVKFPQGAR